MSRADRQWQGAQQTRAAIEAASVVTTSDISYVEARAAPRAAAQDVGLTVT